MAKPNTLVRARPDLAMSLMGYPIVAAMQRAIAYKVMPVIDVPTQNGNYGDIPAGQLLIPSNRKRNSDGSYQRRKLKFGDRSWSTTEYGGEGEVDDRESSIHDDYFDHELLAARVEQFGNVLDAEMRVAAILMNTANFTGRTTAVATSWTNWSASDPIADIEAQKDSIHDACALDADVGWCSKTVLRDLKHNEKIISRIVSEGAGSPAKASDVTIGMIKQVLGLEHLHVGAMSYNAANVNEDIDAQPVWNPDYFGLGVIDQNNNVEDPTLCRAFHWGKDGSQIGGMIEDYESVDNRGHIVRVRHDVDEQIVQEELGHLLTGVG